MIHQIDGRADAGSVVVRVYRNLSKACPFTWSIAADEGTDKGKVIAYANEVTLTACDTVVMRRMHATILSGLSKRGTKRNVVAWTTGKVADGAIITGTGTEMKFDFYPIPGATTPVGEFYSADTGAIITGADVVKFGTVDGHGVAVAS